MGDRSGPGWHRDHGDEADDHAPRHLPSTPPPGRYDLGYGAHSSGDRNGTAVRTPPPTAPATPTPPPTPPPAPPIRPPGPTWSAAAEADTGQMPIVPGPGAAPVAPRPVGPAAIPGAVGPSPVAPRPVGPAAIPGAVGPAPVAPRPVGPAAIPGAAGPTLGSPPARAAESPVLGPVPPGAPHGIGAGLSRPELGRRVPVHARGWPEPPEGARAAGPMFDDGPAYEDDSDDAPRGVRGMAAEAAWRYRSAPMRVRIVADIGAAGLVLLLIVGLALALRQDGGPDHVAANTRRQPSTSLTTTTTVAPTTTTTAPTTTTTAPTTTTTAPTTTTTAAPVVPPPTEAPTTTVAPTTTTTEPVHYRSCRSARSAGALPLRAGEPGYGEHLDSDGDGEACDDYDDWGWGGGGPG